MEVRTLSLVAASDQSYAMGLCVMIRSVLENLRPDVKVDLYVLEDGIDAGTKERIEASWGPYPIATSWIEPNERRLSGRVQDRGHAGVASTYYRFFIGDLLPRDIEKVVYLDVDLIVQGDLADLHALPMNGQPVMAVPDAYSNALHLPRLQDTAFVHHERFVECPRYFNAGVLVIDLAAWREEGFGEQALEIAISCKDRLLFHDQDALNCVFSGRWEPLSPLWNFHELPQSLRRWEVAPLSRRELRELFRSPRIIHFTSSEKPWSATCFSVYEKLFYDYLERTKWAGWKRPELPAAKRLYRAIFITPHVQMNWCLWRGVVHGLEPVILCRLLGVIASRPWALIGYPAWAILSWIREQRFRSPALTERVPT